MAAVPVQNFAGVVAGGQGIALQGIAAEFKPSQSVVKIFAVGAGIKNVQAFGGSLNGIALGCAKAWGQEALLGGRQFQYGSGMGGA